MPAKTSNKVYVVCSTTSTTSVHEAYATLESAKEACRGLTEEILDDLCGDEATIEEADIEDVEPNAVYGLTFSLPRDAKGLYYCSVLELELPDGNVAPTAQKTATKSSKSSKAAKPAASKGTKRAAPSKSIEESDDEEDSAAAPKTKKAKKDKATVRAEAAASLAEKDNLPQGSKTSLEGMKIMITGTLEGVTRNEAEQLIEQHGGIMVKALSAKPDLVCVAAKAGPKKIAEIEKKGIETIDQKGLWAMIQDGDD